MSNWTSEALTFRLVPYELPISHLYEILLLLLFETHSFIHSCILYNYYYSDALSTQHGYCVAVSCEAPHETASEGLALGPTWRLERESNPRPSGRELLTVPMSHHAPNSY